MKKHKMVFIRFFLTVILGILSVSSYGQREKITILAEDDFYPYSGILDKKVQGFSLDVVSAAFNAVNIDVEYNVRPYARCTAEVLEGKGLACFNMGRSEAVENQYLWPKESLTDAAAVIYSSIDNPESNLTHKELEGKTVGATNGYEYGPVIDNNSKIKKELAMSDLMSLKKVANKRVKYALFNENVAKYVIKQNKEELAGKLKVVGKVWTFPLYIFFSKTYKDSQKYLDLFNKGFAEIKANGTYDKLVADLNKKLSVQ